MTQISNLRLPAEWESTGGILLSWPHKDSDWSYMLDEVTKCFTNIVAEIIKEEIAIIVAPDISLPQQHLSLLPQDNIRYVEMATDDTWARDFGPIVTESNDAMTINDFQFNGWGLKFRSCNDNLITHNLMRSGVFHNCQYNNLLGFTLEGGSIESDGKGLLLTTSECLLSPNRNGDLSQQDIEKFLATQLGISKTLWLEFGYLAGDDTDSHIDTLVRICPNDTIAYVGCNNETDEHYQELQAMKQQLQQFTTIDNRPFNLVELPWPDAIYDEDGERLPATYANFLILKDTVLMPSYNQPSNDNKAMEQLAKAFPGYKITAVDCNALIKQHGSLHCVTMQLPAEIINI